MHQTAGAPRSGRRDPGAPRSPGRGSDVSRRGPPPCAPRRSARPWPPPCAIGATAAPPPRRPTRRGARGRTAARALRRPTGRAAGGDRPAGGQQGLSTDDDSTGGPAARCHILGGPTQAPPVVACQRGSEVPHPGGPEPGPPCLWQVEGDGRCHKQGGRRWVPLLVALARALPDRAQPRGPDRGDGLAGGRRDPTLRD